MKFVTSKFALVLIVLFCSGLTSAIAGMPEEYYSSGFFGEGYTSVEDLKAPLHDINNGKINVTFVVDNPENPTEFYGSKIKKTSKCFFAICQEITKYFL